MTDCKFGQREKVIVAHDAQYQKFIGQERVAKMLSHIKDCGECRKTYEDGKKITNFLMDLPVVPVPKGLIEETMQKIKEYEDKRTIITLLRTLPRVKVPEKLIEETILKIKRA